MTRRLALLTLQLARMQRRSATNAVPCTTCRWDDDSPCGLSFSMTLQLSPSTCYILAVGPLIVSDDVTVQLTVSLQLPPPPMPPSPPPSPPSPPSPPALPGTWANPIIIPSLPFVSNPISVSSLNGMYAHQVHLHFHLFAPRMLWRQLTVCTGQQQLITCMADPSQHTPGLILQDYPATRASIPASCSLRANTVVFR